MNNLVLTGRLTDDVELKKTQSGISVCSFTLAVRRPMSKDTTDFLPCVAWRNTAEFITKYFSKGKMIAVEGFLTSRTYEDNQGTKKKVCEVIVNNAEFCGDKVAAKPAEEVPQEEVRPDYVAVNDDDLPF